MRLVVSSNAPWAGTGYATETKGILRGIRDLGHSVALHAWWGLQGGQLTWEGIPCFPGQLDAYGNDAAPHVCKRFKADVLITLIDLWVLNPQLGHIGGTRWAPLFPIDHADPLPAVIAERFPHAHRLLVYSRYAEREVKAYDGGRYADKVRYLPHGVDCAALTPSSAEEKAAYRRKLYPDWPADAFIVGMVAANKGYPCRKSFPEAMEAFALFAANHPEARIYLHSVFGSEMGGPNLQDMARHFGIADRIRFANPQWLMGGDYDDAAMREIYGTLDVLMAPSQGEGFGLPIIEAQSCGVPVAVTDHSAMSELVGDGWRIRPARMNFSIGGGAFAQADVTGIHHALEESYRRPRSSHFVAIAREFAEQYDWRAVMRFYWQPFLAELDGGRREMALELEGVA